MYSGHRPAFRYRLLLPRYWLTWATVLPIGALAILPDAIRVRLGDRIAPWLLRFAPKRQRIAQTNLALCYPELSEQERLDLLVRHTRVLAHTFLGYGCLLFRSPQHLKRAFDVEGMDIVEHEVEKGNNIILLTPHSLALEYAAQYLTMTQGMVCAVRPHAGNEVLDWVVSRLRTRYQGVIYDNSASMLGLVKQVRSGKWLYFLPDEDRGFKNPVFAPFYGVPKASVSVLGKLAKSCRATVIPVMTGYCPDRRRFTLHFHQPLEDANRGDLTEQSLRQNQAIERILDEDRAQYMWSAKIFRTRPDNEASFY